MYFSYLRPPSNCPANNYPIIFIIVLLPSDSNPVRELNPSTNSITITLRINTLPLKRRSSVPINKRLNFLFSIIYFLISSYYYPAIKKNAN